MKITVYNFKGGVGKTNIALNLALHGEFAIVTNDIYSPLEKVLPEERFLKVNISDKMPGFPDDYKIIFDLGGYVDKKAVSALKQSHWVLIPTTADYIDLQITIDCINEVKAYNDRIIVIANRTLKGDIEDIKNVLQRFYDYPIFEIKRSKALPSIFREKKSIQDMVGEGGLKAYNYQAVSDQFNELEKYIGV